MFHATLRRGVETFHETGTGPIRLGPMRSLERCVAPPHRPNEENHSALDSSSNDPATIHPLGQFLRKNAGMEAVGASAWRKQGEDLLRFPLQGAKRQ